MTPAQYFSPPRDATRSERVRRVVQDCFQQRSSGERVDDEAVLAAHTELLPELAQELAKLRKLEAAWKAVERDNSDASRGVNVASANSNASLHVRCPHCHGDNAIPADSSLDAVVCTECGSAFSLVGADARGSDGPRRIGRFELVEQLGVGGFGTVWKARDADLDRLVALKMPRRHRLNPSEAEQFFREARAAAQLRHPHIVTVHEVGRDGDQVYIVSDLIEGPSLAEWSANQRMTAREAAAFCQTVALALAHAHAAGIVHRDLKPGNILLDRDGEPHLTDFGLASRREYETTVTVDGQLVGTPAYMSPEQARGESHQADHRSDLFALGVILYELFTGELPFRGSVRTLLEQIIDHEPAGPRSLNRLVPRDLETICLKCLEKDPARRYDSAIALADDLGRYLGGEPIVARPVGRLERAWRWCKRRPLVTGLTAAVAALLMISAVVATYASIRSTAAAKESRWQQYLSDMHLAMQLWDEGDFGRVVQLLERNRPQPGDDDLRGFEWRYLWHETRRGAETPSLPHDAGVWSVAISPDGQLMATGDESGQVRLWDMAKRTVLRTFRGHENRVQRLQFSPDGSRIASGGTDNTVRLWNVDGSSAPLILEGHREQLLSIAFSPDGEYLASGAAEPTARIWKVSTGELCRTLEGHGEKVGMVAWRNARVLLTLSVDGVIREWDATSGEQLREVARLRAPSRFGALSPDRTMLAIGGKDGVLRILDASRGSLLDAHIAHPGEINYVCFSRDGRFLASAGYDRQALIWNVSTRRVRQSLRFRGHSGAIYGVTFSPDGELLFTASRDRRVKLWNASALAPAADESSCLGHTFFVLDVAFDRSGRRLASASADGTVRLWDAATCATLLSLQGPGGWMQQVAFSPRGTTLAATCNDGSLTLWDATSGRRRWSLNPHGGSDCTFAFSPDGKTIATGGADSVVRFWDAETGSAGQAWPQQSGAMGSLAYSPDGKELAIGHHSGAVNLIDARNGELRRSLAGAGPEVSNVAFSLDGSMLAAGAGSTTRLWDVASGRPLQALEHGDEVSAVVFSPDGKTLATAGQDNIVRLWDIATGDERAALQGHNQWAEAVTFSSDGTMLASASDDRTIRLWRAAPPDVAPAQE